MQNMKVIYLLIISLLLLFISCRKEEILTYHEEEIEDPIKIEGLQFKGIVSGKDGIIPQALIEVYQNQKLVGKLYSDNEGKFNTSSIFLEEGKQVTFYAKKEKYISVAKRVEGYEVETDQKLNLLKYSESIGVPNDLENPGSNDLIKITGKVTAPNGQGVNATILALYNIVEISPSRWAFEGSIVTTDENGMYDFLIAKDQEFYFYVSQNGCNGKSLSQEETIILNGLPVEVKGPFTEDVVFDTYANADIDVFETIQININGAIHNCGPNTNTTVKLKGVLKTGEFERDIDASIDNQFEIKNYFCTNNIPVSSTLDYVIIDNINKLKSDSMSINFNGLTTDLGIIDVCNPIPEDDLPEFQLIVDGKKYEFDISNSFKVINAEVRNDTLFAPLATTDNMGFLRFYIPNIKLGINEIKGFRYLAPLYIDMYIQLEEQITIDITTFGNGKLFGTFNGSLKNTAKNKIESCSGVLNFNYQE